MKRRNFITISTAGIAVLSIPTLYQCIGNKKEINPLIYPYTLAQIWDGETIKVIGSKYLLQVPDENNKQILTSFILNNKSINDSDLKKVIGKQIKKDFETENIVMVDGWVLSTTEIRQCALYSLTKS